LAYLSTSHSRILAICTCVPKRVEKTAGYHHITAEEQNLFIKTTGIKERRVAEDNVTCSDLCYIAAKDILEKFDCAEEIDVVIFVSQSPDYYLPATAVILQDRLKLKRSCLAFDINLGCSGYVYGLSVITNLLQSGQLKKALLLVGDKSTTSTTYTDKSTYPLFGDAGTATLLEHSENAGTWHFNLQSDGSGKNSIMIEHASFETLKEIEPGISRAKKHLILNGFDIFNFALKEVAPNIKSLTEQSGIEINQIDYFIFHQANKLINESVRKKLKLDPEKTPSSIEYFGNTSSASIPLTMCYALKDELRSKKLTLLLSGFGVGFSWGSVILTTENVYTNLTEHD
jgi:3-oxoacyl-[acyl-carrier-protein] synthase III